MSAFLFPHACSLKNSQLASWDLELELLNQSDYLSGFAHRPLYSAPFGSEVCLGLGMDCVVILPLTAGICCSRESSFIVLWVSAWVERSSFL